MSYQLQMVKGQQMLDVGVESIELSHPGILIPMFYGCQSNITLKE
jgi:hypothetical protein